MYSVCSLVAISCPKIETSDVSIYNLWNIHGIFYIYYRFQHPSASFYSASLPFSVVCFAIQFKLQIHPHHKLYFFQKRWFGVLYPPLVILINFVSCFLQQEEVMNFMISSTRTEPASWSCAPTSKHFTRARARNVESEGNCWALGFRQQSGRSGQG